MIHTNILSIHPFNTECKKWQNHKYTILWLQQGTGVLNIDFKQLPFTDNTLVFLTPEQFCAFEQTVLTKAIEIAFDSDFYCIETHDQAIACNGGLFNNIYEIPHIIPNQKTSHKLIKQRLVL